MRIAVLAAAATLSLAGHAVAQDLYAVGPFDPFTPSTLYRVSPLTGAATPVGSTGIAQIADIAFVPELGTIVALSVNADLYTLNLQTGAATLLAAQNSTLPEGGLAWAGALNVFFAVSGDTLGSINRVSGAFTAIGALGPAADDISGLAFGPNNTLLGYSLNGAAPDTLVLIDTATGAASTAFDLGLNNPGAVGGLAATDAALFLSDGANLYNITLVGPALVGPHGVGRVSGLAIPAPGAAAALLLGAGLVARRRR